MTKYAVLETRRRTPRVFEPRSPGTALAIPPAVREWIEALEDRTKRFGERAMALCERLPRTPAWFEVSKQLAAAAGSVAANHRACRRARSTKELASKLQIVSEEVDECVLWFELLDGRHPELQGAIAPLLAEAKELRAIFGSSLGTTRRRLREESNGA